MAPWATIVPSTLVWLSAVLSCTVILPVSLDTKVMVTVILGLLLQLLQSFMGPIRRYSEEFHTQYAAMAAYYLPGVLAFYTANTIWSSSANLYWVMWSIYLLMFSSSGQIEMRRYSLNAGGEQRWRLLQLWLYLAFLQWGSIWTDRTWIVLAVICFCSTTLPLLVFLLIKPRVGVLDFNSKAIADYMRRERVSLLPDVNENMLHAGGKYPVIRAYNGHIITVSDIVGVADDTAQYRDICLSYSYCQLLARRYFGFHCAEEGDERVRDFALTELLPDDDPSYQRAFSITEKQLVFLHDYFFTNYHHWILGFSPLLWSNNPRTERIRLAPIPLFAALFVLAAPFGVVFWYAVLFVIGGPFGVSKFAFHTVAWLLLALIWFFILKPAMPMYWQEVWRALQNDSTDDSSFDGALSVVERYVRWWLRPQLQSGSSQPCWQRKIGQYSLIKDYDSRSFLKAVVAWFNEQILCEVSHGFIRHRPVEEYPVILEDSVMKRVARTLRRIRGPPTNGKTTLEGHEVLDDFGWTLDEETHTHTILIWHIATCYCAMFLEPPVEGTGTDTTSTTEDQQVAVQLSRHCAYLVAFLPQLLPDHSLHTKFVLQQVLQEAKDSLREVPAVASQDEEAGQASRRTPSQEDEEGGQTTSTTPLLEDQEAGQRSSSTPIPEDRRRQQTMLRQVFDKAKELLQLLHKAKDLQKRLTRLSMEQKWERIQVLQLPEDVNDPTTTTTFQKGIKLGKDLAGASARNVESWKVMADFWAETILYVAPSENAAAHIELLPKGGQFVTHLWALLSNAGIFKRATPEAPAMAPAPPGPVPGPA